MHKYRLLARKGKGTFSEVLKAQNVSTGDTFAIKCLRDQFDDIEQVNNLREIQALRRLSPHPNVVHLEEVLFDEPTGRLALVFELMDVNLYELIRGRREHLDPEVVRKLMWELLKAVDHMHRRGVFHRDIKPENILVRDASRPEECLKVADFGSCRGLYSEQPYTAYISTRWYRAPECLITDGYYGPQLDMWGVGCVMFEISCLFPLFPGRDEVDQLAKIHAVLGVPPASVLARFRRKGPSALSLKFEAPAELNPLSRQCAHLAPDCIDLITRLLAYDPDRRISARDALRHKYFKPLRRQERARHRAQADARNGHSRSRRRRKGRRQHGGAASGPQETADRTGLRWRAADEPAVVGRQHRAGGRDKAGRRDKVGGRDKAGGRVRAEGRDRAGSPFEAEAGSARPAAAGIGGDLPLLARSHQHALPVTSSVAANRTVPARAAVVGAPVFSSPVAVPPRRDRGPVLGALPPLQGASLGDVSQPPALAVLHHHQQIHHQQIHHQQIHHQQIHHQHAGRGRAGRYARSSMPGDSAARGAAVAAVAGSSTRRGVAPAIEGYAIGRQRSLHPARGAPMGGAHADLPSPLHAVYGSGSLGPRAMPGPEAAARREMLAQSRLPKASPVAASNLRRRGGGSVYSYGGGAGGSKERRY